MNIRKQLHESTRHPSKLVCNNCQATVSYSLTKQPAALIFTLTDSLGGEVFYCPDCGPLSADDFDGVTVE